MTTSKFLVLVVAAAAVLAVASAFLKEPQKTVEVLVVLDKTGYAKWKVHADRAGNTVEGEITSMMYEVSLIYRPLGVDLRIKGDKPVILSEGFLPVSGVYNNDWYDSTQVLLGFKDLMSRGQYDFDVAMFFSGYTLGEGGSHTSGGRAYIATACSQKGIGVVDNLYDMRQIIAIAHEIGHILGSFHDGEGNSCNDADGYIMTSLTQSKHTNFMTWSPCSSKYIWDFMASNAGWCFKESETSKSSSPINAKRFGKLVGGDEACRRRHGVTAYVSRVSKKTFPVCQAIKCETELSITKDEWRNTWTSHFTPQGMTCGGGASCDWGKCIPDDTVDSAVDENCLFGDTPFLINSMYPSCAFALAGGGCTKSEVVKRACCHACTLAPAQGQKYENTGKLKQSVMVVAKPYRVDRPSGFDGK